MINVLFLIFLIRIEGLSMHKYICTCTWVSERKMRNPSETNDIYQSCKNLYLRVAIYLIFYQFCIKFIKINVGNVK